MKAIMLSIQPKNCELIASGKKTVKVRKTRPQIQTPFKVYIYKTFGKKKDSFSRNIQKYFNCGKVIGEFVCDIIDEFLVFENMTVQYWNYHNLEKSCLTYDEIANYIGANKNGYAWHISDLKIYDTPRELGEFNQECEQYGAENPLCDDCKYFDCCRGLDYDESDCVVDGLIPLSRPPQSWCYCEELSE